MGDNDASCPRVGRYPHRIDCEYDDPTPRMMTRNHSPDREEFCTEVTKRIPLLNLVHEEPRTLKQLDDSLSMSRSTIHRATQSFEEQGILRKDDTHYVLTGFGRVVAREAGSFRERLLTIHRLNDFLNAVQPEEIEVPYEHFADAEVTRPTSRQAHTGVKRVIDLLQETDTVRMFSNIISPLYVDTALSEMLEGTRIEVVFDASVMDIVYEEYASQARRAYETGNFSVYVTEDVPFELFCFDEKIAMAAHDNSARPHVVVESEDPSAIEWARDIYDYYHERAVKVEPEHVSDAFKINLD